MKDKITIPFKRVAEARLFLEKIKKLHPSGMTYASIALKNKQPTVFVTGQFTEEQERYILSLKELKK